MKNITLKIDDQTHRRARILAAQRGTSISAIVREFLIESTSKAGDSNMPAESPTAHAQRVADLDAFFATMDAKAKNRQAKNRPSRGEPLKPMTREEIYAERIR